MLKTEKGEKCMIQALKKEGILEDSFKVTEGLRKRVNYLLYNEEIYQAFKKHFRNGLSFIYAFNTFKNQYRKECPCSYTYIDLERFIEDKKYDQLHSVLEQMFLQPIDHKTIIKVVNSVNIKKLMEHHQKYPNTCIEACVNQISFIY